MIRLIQLFYHYYDGEYLVQKCDFCKCKQHFRISSNTISAVRIHLVDPVDEWIIAPEIISHFSIFQAELPFISSDAQEFTKSCMLIPHMHAFMTSQI